MTHSVEIPRPSPLSEVPPVDGMTWVSGGSFLIGSDHQYPEEAPARPVRVDGFWMDLHAVTNAEFRRFVEASGHVTVAERAPDPAAYPGARPELLVPASVVFRSPRRLVDLRNHYNWWTYVPGADWRHPQGPNSSIDRLDHHPVVHVAHEDVEAYAREAGKELPTEAEWEFAARGGLDGATYAWGEDLLLGGEWMANTWQGTFPVEDLGLDGYVGTAPVRSFPPNAYGLHEMTGNVWEWTADWYDERRQPKRACCAIHNPRGGERERSYDRQMPGIRIPRKVMKGGSYLCAPNYCRRYRPAARMPQPIDTSTCHLGFRCIVRPASRP